MANNITINISANAGNTSQVIRQVVNQLNGLSSSCNQTTRSMSNSFKSMANGIKVAIAGAITYATGRIMQMGLSVESTINRINATFGGGAQDVKDWAAGIASAFGVNANNLLGSVSQLGVLLKGYGVGAKDLQNMSKSLTLLGKDYAALYGLSEADVFGKMLSGIRGETEAIEDLGVNLKASKLDEVALGLGIDKKVAAMSGAEQAYIRYIAIMQQSGNAQGYFEKSLDTTTAKFNRVKETVIGIGQTIGQIFGAIFGKLYGFIMSILNLVQGALNWVTKAFNIKPVEIKIEDGGGGLGDAASGVKDVNSGLKETEKAAKKAKGSLAGFDEIITITKPADTTSKDKGAGDSGGVGGIFGDMELPTYDWDTTLKGETDKMENSLSSFVDRAKIKMGELTGRTVDFGFNADEAKVSLEGIISNVTSTLAGVGTLFLDIGIRVLDDLNIGSIFNSLLATIESFTGLVSTAFNTLKEPILNFYEIALKPVVEWIGEKLKDALDFVSVELDKWSTWFVDNKDLIMEFTTFVAELCADLWKLIEPLLDVGWELFKDILSKVGELIRDIITWIMENKEAVLLFVTTFVGAWAGIKIAGLISDFMTLSSLLGGGLAGGFRAIVALLSSTRLGMIASSVATNVMAAAQAALNFVMSINPIALVIGALVGLVAGLVVLYNKCDWFRELVNKLWEQMKVLGEYIAKAFVDAWNYLGDAINNIKEKFSKLCTYLGGVFTTAVKNVATTFTNVFDGIKKVFSGILDFVVGVFTGNWSKAWGGVKDIFAGIWDSFVGIAKKPINLVIDMVNGMIRGLNKFKIDIPDWVSKIPGMGNFGGKSFGLNISTIPHLATGGLVTGDTLARIGEQGYKEVVLPLERNTGWMDDLVGRINTSSSGNKTININGDYASLRELVKMLQSEMQDIQVNYGDFNYGV